MTQAKRAAIIRAVERAKRSEFKVTAIKVELEAQLNRRGDFGGTEFCHNWIMARLADLGLAERGEYHEIGHDDYFETEWYPVNPLVYGEFYRDGSVDSEFTFTIMLDNPENIFLLPQVIKVFRELGEANGNNIDVRGAGMHLAFLDDEKGVYPSNASDPLLWKFYNFQQSMKMLLPALYFLGSNDENSRGLDFRRPDIGHNTHRTAIDYREGALEFRIFDTCYDSPETILDNFVVMSRTLKYWRKKFKSSGVEKVATRVKFGADANNLLERFYVTYTHLDLLNFGLRRLKPPYYTVGQVKAQRKFTTDKRKLARVRKEQERSAEAEYKEYEDRFGFSLLINRSRHMEQLTIDMDANMRIGAIPRKPVEEVQAEIEAEAEKRVEVEKKHKKSIKGFVSDRLKQIENACGEWTLAID